MSAPRLGVVGWPVAHSRSPAMQNAALRAAGLEDWRFQLLPMPPDGMVEAVRALPGAGFRGASVTIPHKEAVLGALDEISGPAREIGAVNTLVIDDSGRIRGENTDAPGFIAALPAEVGPQTAATVLGAGGSARAVAWALRSAGAQVRIWNRTPERARELAGELGVEAVDRPASTGILVNCTAAGMDGDPFETLPVGPDALEPPAGGCVAARVVHNQRQQPALHLACSLDGESERHRVVQSQVISEPVDHTRRGRVHRGVDGHGRRAV